jgi:predicted RNA methylase
MLLGDIMGKSVVDLCSGTGVLAISAALLDAEVTAIEIDPDAIEIFQSNISDLELEIDIIQEDVFKWDKNKKFDTALINPPFGIQQRKFTDIDFLIQATKIANTVYSIHDGSPANQTELTNILLKNNIELIDFYLDEFPLDKLYPWHKLKKKIHQVMIIRSRPL